MKMTFKTLVIGASIAVGMSAIVAPANAGSLTGATITGTDIIKYKVNQNNQTVADPNASLSDILTGDSSNPTGNVELFASSERYPLSPTASATASAAVKFANTSAALQSFLGYTQVTTLSGGIGGKQITLSSLTASDWFGAAAAQTAKTSLATAATPNALNTAINGLYNPSNLATTWFNQALSTYSVTPTQALFNTFLMAGGFQRFSDPNISYVNQDDTTGQIKIGLAGHFDASTLLGLPTGSINRQASEIVKVAYNGNAAQYLYSFNATRSGLIAQDDGISHNGNYEVSLQGVAPQTLRNPQAVPEPSVMFGLLGVAGVFATQRKSKKVSA